MIKLAGKQPKLAACRKAALLRELGDVDTVLGKAHHHVDTEAGKEAS